MTRRTVLPVVSSVSFAREMISIHWGMEWTSLHVPRKQSNLCRSWTHQIDSKFLRRMPRELPLSAQSDHNGSRGKNRDKELEEKSLRIISIIPPDVESPRLTIFLSWTTDKHQEFAHSSFDKRRSRRKIRFTWTCLPFRWETTAYLRRQHLNRYTEEAGEGEGIHLWLGWSVNTIMWLTSTELRLAQIIQVFGVSPMIDTDYANSKIQAQINDR